MKKIDKELAKLGPRGKFERKNRVAEFYKLTKKDGSGNYTDGHTTKAKSPASS